MMPETEIPANTNFNFGLIAPVSFAPAKLFYVIALPHAFTNIDMKRNILEGHIAAMANNTSTFHYFPRLPPELRDLIWQAALPDEVKPALIAFKKGGWIPVDPIEDEEAYQCSLHTPESNTPYKHLVCHYDQFDAIQVEVPLFSVNHEARSIALPWLWKHRILIWVCRSQNEQLQPPVLERCFDPKYDLLYVATDDWDDFFCEANDRCFETDLIDKYLCTHSSRIKSLTIPLAVIQSEEEFSSLLSEQVVILIASAPLIYNILTCMNHRRSIIACSECY